MALIVKVADPTAKPRLTVPVRVRRLRPRVDIPGGGLSELLAVAVSDVRSDQGPLQSLGGAASPLGFPSSAAQAYGTDGLCQSFTGGAIIWTPSTGAYIE
ncbi:LGFP repeat-containing protein [Rhodococcus sp. HS-D2]|uniref:LGFP repeat-containing protein n=1 Tax=Rhodococcus sp. HS-D2 TaxID=1384636 RepID=UPI001E5DBBB3|nr:hypothetical protein [Rhodococcus sp. HS-D2]